MAFLGLPGTAPMAVSTFACAACHYFSAYNYFAANVCLISVSLQNSCSVGWFLVAGRTAGTDCDVFNGILTLHTQHQVGALALSTSVCLVLQHTQTVIVFILCRDHVCKCFYIDLVCA